MKDILQRQTQKHDSLLINAQLFGGFMFINHFFRLT